MPDSAASITTDQLRPFLAGKNIGLSISDNADRTKFGFERIHQSTFMYEVARTLYRCGASISYGGHLRNEGFTVASLQHLIDEQQSAIEDQRIQSYIAWPLNCRPSASDDGLQDDFLKFAEIIDLPPPDEFPGAKHEFLDAKTVPNRYYWFRSLTEMRQKMNSEIHARVVLGGKLRGFVGRYPGVVEEVLIAIGTKTPLYLCGGFGGAAGALAQLCLGKTAPELDLFSPYADDQYATSASYYEAATAVKLGRILDSATPYGRFVGYSVDYPLLCEFIRVIGIGGLNNGLTAEENRILFETPSLDEIRMLILSGLARLFSATGECESSQDESALSPDAAFKQAIQGVSRPRSPLINDFQAFALDSADELLSLESELFPILGDGYLNVRQPALQPCAPAICEQYSSISNARSVLNLDLAALSWLPARSQYSMIAEFLAELAKANPAVANGKTVRRHLPTAKSCADQPQQSSMFQSESSVCRPVLEGSTSMQLLKHYEEFQNAILHAFNEGELRMLLRLDLEFDFNVDVPSGSLRERVFALIEIFDSDGRVDELFAAALKRKPKNPKLRELARKLADEVSQQHSNLAERALGNFNKDLENPQADAMRTILSGDIHSGALQALIVQAPHLQSGQDVEAWQQRYTIARGRVCLIRRNDQPLGTGFLIGPDRIMTNSHVVDAAIPIQEYNVVFDFRGETAIDSLAHYTLTYELARSKPREYDYAIFRLNQIPAGNRGWFKARPYQFNQLREPVSLLGHPNGDPLKFSFGVVFDNNSFMGRVAYTANSAPGSSGSPVFSENWELLALHHHGETGVNNHGIPMKSILEDLKRQQKEDLLESA